jgi:hypothetical protein
VTYDEAEAAAMAALRKKYPDAIPARRYAREDARAYLVGWDAPSLGDFAEDAEFVFVDKRSGAVELASALESLKRVAAMAAVS